MLVRRKGREIGYFRTPEEGALAYARNLRKEAPSGGAGGARHPPYEASEAQKEAAAAALARAQSEGLELARSTTSTSGFLGVSYQAHCGKFLLRRGHREIGW